MEIKRLNYNESAKLKCAFSEKTMEDVTVSELSLDDYKSSLLDTRSEQCDVGKPRDVFLPWTSFKYKTTRTVFIVLGHASMGMFLEIVGPTLPDLKSRVGINYEEMSRALMVRSLGYLFGSLLNGVLTDLFPLHVELVASIGYVVAAVGVALSPWSRVLWFLALCFFLQGYGQGAMDVCNNTLVLRIWGQKAAAPIFALHIGFGIGALFASQLARPFITRSEVEDILEWNLTSSHSAASNSSSTLMETALNHTLHDNEFTSHTNPIEIPYLIISLYTLIWSIQFIVVYILERLKKKQLKIYDDFSKESKCALFTTRCSSEHKESEAICFLVMFFSFMCVYFFTTVGVEQSFSKFIFSFAMESDVGLDAGQASNLNSLFWLSFMVGRTLMIPIAIFVPADIYSIGVVVGDAICATILAFFGVKHILMLWTFTALFGLFHGPLSPCAYGWANLYVEMGGSRVAALTVACALGQMMFQWATGYVFEYYGSEAIMYINLVHGALLVGSFTAAYVVAKRKGQRFNLTTEDAINMDVSENCEERKQEL